MDTPVVVVFSGGQDSTTCLLQAINKYQIVHCITFNYGQRHRKEIDIARDIAIKLGVKTHKFIDISIINEISSSSLTKDHLLFHELTGKSNNLPLTFVPGRNIIFLTMAAIYAYQVHAEKIITGVCETDFSGYPDCRNDFIIALNKAISLGIDKKLFFETPLMWLTKAETWALADQLGMLYFVKKETITCYNGIKSDGCGQCDACHLRDKGLQEYLNNKISIEKSLKDKYAIKKY